MDPDEIIWSHAGFVEAEAVARVLGVREGPQKRLPRWILRVHDAVLISDGSKLTLAERLASALERICATEGALDAVRAVIRASAFSDDLRRYLTSIGAIE